MKLLVILFLVRLYARINIFKYFREKIANNGILFLQETHSSHDTVINWRDDFKGELFFHMEPQIHAVS